MSSESSDLPFDPESVEVFRFVGHAFDETTATAHFDYALEEGDGTVHAFREEIVFPGTGPELDPPRREALARALRLLHLTAGVSYYKAALPREIHVDTEPLTRDEARFFETLYLHGLGELAYRNGLDLRGRIRFPAQGARPAAPPVELPRRTAVPVGGGKDSIVTLETLRRADEPMVLISVGDPRPIRETAAVSGLEHLVVRRRIAPELIELNRRGAINGHVPISAILATIFAVASITEGFDVVALSNERSADEPNLTVDGFAVNHQYSKSSAFERDFQELLAHELPGFRYFSFLRPLSELTIAGMFARLSETRYRTVFRSCNTAFKLDEARRSERWCCDCPKCRFVYLALAPYLEPSEMVEIFGADLLADPNQEPGYREMLGLDGHKPFECVGEIEECVAALVMLDRRKEWTDALLVRRLADEVLPRLEDPDRTLRDATMPRNQNVLPAHFGEILEGVSR